MGRVLKSLTTFQIPICDLRKFHLMPGIENIWSCARIITNSTGSRVPAPSVTRIMVNTTPGGEKTEMNVAWLRYLRKNISKSDARYDWIFVPSHGISQSYFTFKLRINLTPSATSVLVDAPNGLFATGVCASATLVRRERLIAESRTKNIHHNALCKTSVTNIPAFSFTFSVVTRKKY